MTAAGTKTPGEPTLRDWLAVTGGILGAFMALLDIQITNASLAEIGGAIGATPSEGSWISTGYLMAEIIVIPLTGWLARTFGLRNFLVVNSALFIGFSILCAMSNSLGEMILWRAGQGLTGGVLIPTAITIVRTKLPPAKQPVGVALFGMVATFAPAIGPTVGGWLTDNWSWDYIFYLNIVPGAVALALQYGALDPEKPRFSEFWNVDWLGIFAMAIGLSSLIFVLEEGQREEWYESNLIVAGTIAAAIGIAVFLIAELTAEKPFINLRLFANPSVGGSAILMGVFGATAFGSVYLIPAYLAQVQGYSAQQIGEVVMWSGIPQLFLLPVMPWLMKKVDLRLLVLFGLLMFAASCFINVEMSPDTAMDQLILPQLLRAAGQPFATIPLTQLSMVGLTRADTTDSAAITSVMRNLGASVGIAMLSTIVQFREQEHFSTIAEAVTQNGVRLQERLHDLAGVFASRGTDAAYAAQRGVDLLAQQVRLNASVMAYADAFWMLGICIMVSLLTLLILRKPPVIGVVAVDAH
ncbi:MAG: DHA2 family efflux MFS transporter permease subunit [Alphaproteobacteria bacterium]|nr:DHA2 family efflux MFS transporter permease subunit [Alphaproteobacteria bacterium]